MRDSKDKNPEHGAALVELAIVLPLLLLILMGIVEIGLLFYNQQILTNSSREGARAAIARSTYNGVVLDANAIEDIVEDYLGLGKTYTDRRLITFGSDSDPDVTTNGLGGVYGTDLTVTVGYDHPFLFPELLNLGASIHLSAQTVMKMERFIAPPTP
jgi:Flp pilus assembly protein TadG